MKKFNDFLNESIDENYVIELLKNLSTPQMKEFLRYIYEEGVDNVEYNDEEGYSSVSFDGWLDSNKEMLFKEYNRIRDRY